MRMHSVLLIPELVQEICDNVARVDVSDCHGHRDMDGKSLANLARTCVIFRDPSLNILWQQQNGLSNLLQCLPHSVWQRLPPVEGHGGFESRKILNGLGFTPVVFAGYPADPRYRMVTLQRRRATWAFAYSTPAARFFQIYEFLRGNLGIPHVFPTGTLDKFAFQTSSSSFHYDLTAQATIQSFITGLETVTSVEIDCLSQESFHHLSTLRSLRRLTIKDADSPLNWIFNPSPSLSDLNSFPSLEALSFSWIPVGCIMTILETCPAPIPNLHTVTLQLQSDMMVDASKMCSLFQAIINRSPPGRLTNLKTTLIPMSDVRPDALDRGFLELLFPCTNLVHLDLRLGVGFSLDDSDVHLMARVWPCLQTLALTAPVSRYSCSSSVTFQGLVAFATHCPALSSLTLTLDTTTAPTGLGGGGICQNSLETLNVGPSRAPAAMKTAIFLYHLFPNLRSIDNDYEVAEDDVNQRWMLVTKLIENLRTHGCIPFGRRPQIRSMSACAD
ncbi:hypothetical protein C8F04DRAFT_1190918 [Mycena alexandri]|uniref:F-box domain-containing protein n=1 Tax=Mycena alexandri TaxID=1745969 RepID=A0AAD6SDK8_9AGAR|nr:hypothetical protein C8F04DRAFT_1190918 [Mycena alexandri]